MRAGTLRHRVTIQQKSVTRDSYGAEVVTWTDLDTVWAAVEPLSGREYLAALQTQAEVTTRIRLRYRSDLVVEPEMRVTWDGHTYDVLAAIETQARRREVQLMCREAV